jgi:hypothetical protein
LDATCARGAVEPLRLEESEARGQHALNLLLTHQRNAAIEIDRLLEDDPESVFGHCLRSALIVRADDTSARQKLAASVAAIEAGCPDPRSQAHRHATAALAWLAGNQVLAAELYGSIVVDWPRDILALVAAHAFDFRLSRKFLLRDRIAQVLPEWEPNMPGYPSVLVMYAFGLEENGEYGRAEAIARRALAIDPTHPGAIHVVAHVMEMRGRVQEGLAFLARTAAAWINGTGFSIHLAWHRALLHLEADDVSSALAVYDSQMADGSVWDLAARAVASALLWRLELQKVRLGDRWQQLVNRWQMQQLANMQPFYLMHATMAFAAAGRTGYIAGALKSLPAADSNIATQPLIEKTLTPWVCKALMSFGSCDYEACAEWLGRIRPIANLCGGSLAQCDVLHLTYTEAALRSQNAPLARALVAERTARKPESSLNRVLQQRLAELMRSRSGKLAANGSFTLQCCSPNLSMHSEA